MPSSTQHSNITYREKPPGDKHIDYYEAKIQIRPYNEEVIRYVINGIDNNEKVRISKVIELKTGVDIYVSSRKFATSIGKKLRAKFKEGKILVTKTLFSKNRQTSKNIYRVTVLFRLN
ncbi:MAG: NMD3-related protein [Nanoarchaeota archaeon]|nr:NMD3-related protein [Nanoarchaeota archaeon]